MGINVTPCTIYQRHTVTLQKRTTCWCCTAEQKKPIFMFCYKEQNPNLAPPCCHNNYLPTSNHHAVEVLCFFFLSVNKNFHEYLANPALLPTIIPTPDSFFFFGLMQTSTGIWPSLQQRYTDAAQGISNLAWSKADCNIELYFTHCTNHLNCNSFCL